MNKKEIMAKIKQAQEIADRGLIFDAPIKLAANIDPTTGFLNTPVKLARVGVQTYFGFELGMVDRALDKIGVFRPSEEVFADESVKSFTNLVVTDDHPNNHVTTDNVKELQKGTVSHVEPDDKVLKGIISITDKEMIQKILAGKDEVSVGYSNNLVEKEGTFEGDAYEFIQTDIIANHLAIVDAGRCGTACKLTTDQKGGFHMIKITIDGIEYEVPEQVAQAFNKYKATMDQKLKDQMSETEAEKKKKEDAEKEKEAAEAKADAAKEKNMSDEDIAKLVDKKANLIATAKTILGDKFDEATKDCGTCDTKMKAAVIGKVMPDIDLSGKKDAYVDAMFDIAVDKHGATKDSLDTLNSEFKDKDGKTVTRDSIRQKHNKEYLNLEVS